MNTKKVVGLFLGALVFLSTNFVVKAGCDEMADKNLQVADGMTTGQIRKLIESASSSVIDVNEQALKKSN